jgi:acetylornithine/succinyldiaminopimelate/putrescine aminotransferase
MMTLAKALGGGLPIGATLLTDKVASVMELGDHGSTFAGGPVICRVAEVVLDRISSPTMLAHINAMGELLQERLEELHSPHIQDVRGLGLMVGIEMDQPVASMIKAGHAHGVLMINAGANILRLLPPLIVEESHIDEFVTTLGAILTEN